jgi:hypothetical protein
MYVKLPKLMKVNQGRALYDRQIKKALVKEMPHVIDKAIKLFGPEISDLESAIKDCKDAAYKAELEKELAEVRQGLSDFEALAPKPVAKAKKGK